MIMRVYDSHLKVLKQKSPFNLIYSSENFFMQIKVFFEFFSNFFFNISNVTVTGKKKKKKYISLRIATFF